MPRQIRSAAPGRAPQLLQDPLNDRNVVDVALPPAEALTMESCYDESGQPDMDCLRKHLELEGAISQELLFDLIEKAADLFDQEPNMLKLSDPITVVGDIHGQFWDLMNVFKLGGIPGDTQYLFLGDYVDRGCYSVEVLAYLFAWKVKQPKRIHMLRGNHECRQMTAFFNFREECEYKYDVGIYNAFMEAFDTLPLCATINNKYFAVHGGISPDLRRLEDLASVERMQETPRQGLVCDLLWADPSQEEENGGVASTPFLANGVRGCSHFFSSDAAAKFLRKNSFLCIVRAHEAQIDGYKMHKTNALTGFPCVITVFSAPNYCDTYNNKAAILNFTNSTLNVMQFNCSPHPYYLPNFMDVFAWSMPFVLEKVLEFANEVFLNLGDGGSDDPEVTRACRESNDTIGLVTKLNEHIAAQASNAHPNHSASSGADAVRPDKPSAFKPEDLNRMRRKVKSIGRLARMFKTLREENEQIIKLKGICPGHRLQPGVLLEGKERIRSELEHFSYVSGIDVANEAIPEDDGATVVMTRSLSLHRRKAGAMSPKSRLEQDYRDRQEADEEELADV